MNTKINNSPVRSISAEVGLYKGSTLVNTFHNTDRVKSFTIESTGADSFFGFGICRRLNLKLVDTKREVNITTENSIVISLDGAVRYPTFYVSEARRDENTNELSITGYDAIYPAATGTVADLTLPADYTLKLFAEACGKWLKCPVRLYNLSETENPFSTLYQGGANFSGQESVRDAIDDVAEATQTIYYIDKENNLVFRRLDMSAAGGAAIDRENYFTLKSGTNRRIAEVCATTELGDNVSAKMPYTGSTAYIRDNAFWNMREDISTLVDKALAAVGGFTLNQFNCSWRGDYTLELGDKLSLTTKDNNIVISYLLNDKISYDGSFKEETQWKYEGDQETASNPSSLGEALNNTFAKVDKVNKKIDLVIDESKGNESRLTQLELTQGKINASVSNVENTLAENIETTNQELATLTEKVNTSITSEDVQIQIDRELANGVDKVITSTGYKFDQDGLLVSKSGSEMKTQISDDGMRVFRGGSEVLTANNTGVDATNLHATTYLIIGKNSRLEDYGSNRTGCFWIGR